MKEEIAEKRVKPRLMKLNFLYELISGYKKVPVQTGSFRVFIPIMYVIS